MKYLLLAPWIFMVGCSLYPVEAPRMASEASGYLVDHPFPESGGWQEKLIWALGGAAVVGGAMGGKKALDKKKNAKEI